MRSTGSCKGELGKTTHAIGCGDNSFSGDSKNGLYQEECGTERRTR